MINSQKRDIAYTFAHSVHRPVLTQVIDDEWRKEKFTDLDIILTSKIVQTKLNLDQGDEEMQQRIPITEVREWNDVGLQELISQFIDPAHGGEDDLRGGTNLTNLI
jgi:hypothetical protein